MLRSWHIRSIMMSLISRAVSHETTSPARIWPSSIRLAIVDHAVEHAEAGVADVVDRGVRADAQRPRRPGRRSPARTARGRPRRRSGRRPGRRRTSAASRRVPGRRDRPVGEPVALLPPPPLDDPGQRLELPRAEVQRLVDRRRAAPPARPTRPPPGRARSRSPRCRRSSTSSTPCSPIGSRRPRPSIHARRPRSLGA